MDCLYNSIKYFYNFFVSIENEDMTITNPSYLTDPQDPQDPAYPTDPQDPANSGNSTDLADLEVHKGQMINEVQDVHIHDIDTIVKNMNLKKWDPNELKAHGGSTCLIIGKRAVGKSTLAIHLADQLSLEDTKVLAFSAVGKEVDYVLNDNTSFYCEYESSILADHINEIWENKNKHESVVLLDDVFYSAKIP